MDIGSLIKNINSLNDYVAATNDASEKCRTSRIQLNMSTVLALKKIRSFEIEYVNKCEENGIACVIFERMLCLPPSKTWGVLSKEMVNLLKYWLDAVRKHLIKHSSQWWSFLKLLLKFIKEIRIKDKSVPDILVEHTAECLLDLATAERPDAMQRYEILHCFNMYCAESGRNIRFALRSQLGQYFTKLANYMSGCGNLSTQYSIMETLLRWLVPRQDRTLRITSATKWFPARLYADNTVDIFLERPWMNFFQDARDFLNSHNERSDLITSVVCRKASVGDIVIISDADRMDSWLDINSTTKCISVLLDPRVLDVFGCTNHKSFETFVVAEDNTVNIKLNRQSDKITLSVHTVNPPAVLPSCIKLGDDVSCDVTIIVTSRCDMKRLDAALRGIFEDKYQLLLDLEQKMPLSPVKVTTQSSKLNKSEPDPRFSHPVELKKRPYHSGYMVRSRAPLSCMSPSTASTSSLAQLHDKLAALPKYTFEKEPQSVCALPELSVVSEASEFDERSTKTLNFESYGKCNKNQGTLDGGRKSQSDNESNRRHLEASRRGKYRELSPIVKDNESSCLLVATVGSADESVINDTVERISNCKDFNPDNIVDLLVQEALQANLEKDKDKNDSGINSGEKKSQYTSDNCDAIEGTPNEVLNLNKADKRCSKVVSPTSDESNTEEINDSPDYVNRACRSKKARPKVNNAERQSFDITAVEEFFSQHYTANKDGDIVISPTLAKKINETSSETSEDHFGDDFNIGDDLHDVVPCDFNNIEVLECLNNIVDKVCDDFDKYLNVEQETLGVDNTDVEDNLPLKDILNTIQNISPKTKVTEKTTTCNKIKLKFRVGSKKVKKSRTVKGKTKLEIESVSKMSTIIEDNAEIDPKASLPIEPEVNVEKQNEPAPEENKNECTTPLQRRKRKLFSPKDEHIIEEVRVEVHADPKDRDSTSKIKRTPKSKTTYKPYKEIEKEKARRIRMPRNRRSKVPEAPSPRSKKLNEIFDKVKESADGEKVTLANKQTNSDEYNFTTDSEDDFKEKKIDISRKTSNTTLDSVESTVLRRGRVVKRVNYSGKNEDKNNKRKVNRRQKAKKGVEIEQPIDLIDERMREHKDVLNTSITVEHPEVIVTEPEPILEKRPEMEAIDIIEDKHNDVQPKTKRSRKGKPKINAAKGAKKPLNIKPNAEGDRTESPLPGLVVEEAPTAAKEDADISANMVDKFKKICQNPEQYINESNTTQNLLSDNERVVYSPQNVVIEDCVSVKSQVKKESKAKGSKVTKKTNITKGKSNKVRKNSVEVPKKPESDKSKQSDRSIATDGITGHGDSEEAPPNTKLIVEKLEHRNLHTEYLDHSTKDYFDKLIEDINDINNTTNDFNKTGSSPTLNTSNRENSNSNLGKKSPQIIKLLKSPVVSIERGDIRRWLPSSRNSETDLCSPSTNRSKLSNNGKNIESSRTPNKSTNSDDDPEIQEAIRQSLRESISRSPILKINSSISRKSRNKSKELSPTNAHVTPKKVATKMRIQPTRQVKCTPKSVISPIKLFDDLLSNADRQSQTTLSDDEEYMNEIKQTLTSFKKHKTQSVNTSQESITKNNIISMSPKKSLQRNLFVTSVSQSSHSRVSTSTKIEHSGLLKRSLEEDIGGRKKKRIEDNNNIGDVISGSGVTVSSVDDWFRRSEPSGSRAEEIDVSIKDSIHNVMEKLDTTLVEIHQSTSNKFVHLFVAAQQQLLELKEKRKHMYKQIATDILSSVLRTLDEKFAELNDRSEQQDTEFMKQLKERASAVIREDCKKKRVMVQLLKEDVNAVLQHMARRNQ